MIFRLVGALLVASLLLACGGGESAPPATPATDSLREIEQGQLVGTVGRYGGHVWRGIPFAKPPVGPLRWRAPQHPDGWQGQRQAIEPGAFCPQFASRFGGVPGEQGEIYGDEDCLVLDVYAPQFSQAKVPADGRRLPVLVWIHGGGNVIGSARFYDGSKMAERHDVVVVAIQYRLGPLGWFRHEALRAGDTTAADRSGNFGTLDMIRALEWVRGNIAAFGGDPQNVTIFGESAGGTDVYTMLLSKQAAGLFHRAIPQSGGTYLSDPVEAEAFVEDGGNAGSSNEVLLSLLQADGAADRAAAKRKLSGLGTAELAAYLRGKDAAAFLSMYAQEEAEGLIDVPKLFAEGTVLPVEPPLERFARADGWNVVPVLAGTNRDENKLFMYANPRWVKQWFGFLPRLQDPEGFELQARYASLMWKARGSDEPTAAMRQVSDDVWSYRFDWDEEPTVLGADLSAMLGAAHGFEIPFVFGHFDLGRAGNIIFTDDNLAGREELSSRMMSYWVQFAASGDPGRGRDGSLASWKRWDPQPGASKFLLLDTDADGGLRMSPDAVTEASVAAMAAADPALLARDDRCAILRDVLQWSSPGVPADCAQETKQVARAD